MFYDKALLPLRGLVSNVLFQNLRHFGVGRHNFELENKARTMSKLEILWTTLANGEMTFVSEKKQFSDQV